MKLDTAKLAIDLRDAINAARIAGDSEDGGTCNLDHLVLRLDGARMTTIQTIATAAGAGYVSRYHRGEFNIGISAGGQANSRTRAVEAARDVLRGRGWSAHVSYITD